MPTVYPSSVSTITIMNSWPILFDLCLPYASSPQCLGYLEVKSRHHMLWKKDVKVWNTVGCVNEIVVAGWNQEENPSQMLYSEHLCSWESDPPPGRPPSAICHHYRCRCGDSGWPTPPSEMVWFHPEDDVRNQLCTADSCRWCSGRLSGWEWADSAIAALELILSKRPGAIKKYFLTHHICTLSASESLSCNNTRTLISCFIKFPYHFSQELNKDPSRDRILGRLAFCGEGVVFSTTDILTEDKLFLSKFEGMVFLTWWPGWWVILPSASWESAPEFWQPFRSLNLMEHPKGAGKVILCLISR